MVHTAHSMDAERSICSVGRGPRRPESERGGARMTFV